MDKDFIALSWDFVGACTRTLAKRYTKK